MENRDLITEEHFFAYLRSQMYRVYSASFWKLQDHIYNYHVKPLNYLKFVDTLEWKMKIYESKKIQDCFGHLNCETESHISDGYVWYLLMNQSKTFLQNLSGYRILGLGVPQSFAINQSFHYCPIIKEEVNTFLENILLNKLENIKFHRNCDCDFTLLPKSCFTSFISQKNRFDETSFLTRLCYSLLHERFSFFSVKDIIHLFHNILPPLYEFEQYV